MTRSTASVVRVTHGGLKQQRRLTAGYIIKIINSRYTRAEYESSFGTGFYVNSYDADDLLYPGEAGAGQYIARGAHRLEGSVTIADGGIGEAHPYLSGEVLPSYVGAVNPADSDWVQGVLDLADLTALKNGSGDPAWVE